MLQIYYLSGYLCLWPFRLLFERLLLFVPPTPVRIRDYRGWSVWVTEYSSKDFWSKEFWSKGLLGDRNIRRRSFGRTDNWSNGLLVEQIIGNINKYGDYN